MPEFSGFGSGRSGLEKPAPDGLFRPGDDYELHDYSDPDHSRSETAFPTEEEEPIISLNKSELVDESPRQKELRELGLADFTSRGLPPPVDSDVKETGGEGKIIRHRKVYVAKKDAKEPVVHPIQITIPVRLEEAPTLSTPKPIYRMKKITSYNQKQEIKMVPVTKTIYKPANITSDQIIE